MEAPLPESAKMERKSMRKGRQDRFALFLALVILSLLPASDLRSEGGGTIVGTVARGPQRLSNVVVYIERVERTFHPPKEAAIMNQQNLTYVPHVLPILVGTTVDFVNSDGLLHNLHAFMRGETLFNIAMPKFLKKKSMVFQKEGPVLLLCDVHREMSAYIMVLQNPFFALTNEEGDFTIKDVPPGSYTVKAWHENLKPQGQEVKLMEGRNVRFDFKLRQ
jgi:plastocyanin